MERDTHRGWLIEQNWLGQWEATSPNYDASYEGPEDGWVSNGEYVTGSSREEVCGLIDEWFEDHSQFGVGS